MDGRRSLDDVMVMSSFLLRLPLVATVSTLGGLYLEYVFLHGLRLLQLDLAENSARDEDSVHRGKVQLAIFHFVTGLLVYCFLKSMFMDPGMIPDGEGWELGAGQAFLSDEAHETKRTGERRQCKWCFKYKPDRCHHCRVCARCVLRMDHHCQWVNNCIGLRNYKYFLLLLVYVEIDLVVILATMFESVWWSARVDVSVTMFLAMLFGETFAAFLAIVNAVFLGFHLWLVSKAMTTLEFCEKARKQGNYDPSMYSEGSLLANLQAVLGPQPLFWLLPVPAPEHNMGCGSHGAATARTARAGGAHRFSSGSSGSEEPQAMQGDLWLRGQGGGSFGSAPPPPPEQ